MFRRDRRDRLAKLRERMRQAREELDVASAQALALREEADDLRVRALASDRPGDRSEAADADKHARAAEDARDRLRVEVANLTREVDDELDRRIGGT
jgi:hypothetical protein